MSTMSLPRLLAGGCIAGLIMNVGEAALHAGVLGQETEAVYKTLNALAPNPSTTIPILVAMTFVLGIVAIWLYAAITPRFGRGAKTAAIAGVVVWVLAHAWSGAYLGAGYAGLITPRLALIPVVWGLFEAVLGTVAGAALYKDR